MKCLHALLRSPLVLFDPAPAFSMDTIQRLVFDISVLYIFLSIPAFIDTGIPSLEPDPCIIIVLEVSPGPTPDVERSKTRWAFPLGLSLTFRRLDDIRDMSSHGSSSSLKIHCVELFSIQKKINLNILLRFLSNIMAQMVYFFSEMHTN